MSERLERRVKRRMTMSTLLQTATKTMSAKHGSYIVRLSNDATEDDMKQVKQGIENQGGKIGHEYQLIKGKSRRNAADEKASRPRFPKYTRRI